MKYKFVFKNSKELNALLYKMDRAIRNYGFVTVADMFRMLPAAVLIEGPIGDTFGWDSIDNFVILPAPKEGYELETSDPIHRGSTQVSNILERILNDKFKETNTYVILGKSGPTGKTWLWNELTRRGLKAVEISEPVAGLIEYNDNQNHYIEPKLGSTVVIVLNRRLK